MTRLCLVEDHEVAGLEPLTLTRPAFELRLGSTTLGEKIARAFAVGPGPHLRGAVLRTQLAAGIDARPPSDRWAVNDRDWLARGPVVVANARWIPPVGFVPPQGITPWLGVCDGRPACALVGPERALGLEPHLVNDWFDDVSAKFNGVDIGGEWIDRPWDLVDKNSRHIERDFEVESRVGVTNRHLATAAVVGPIERLFIHESARIDPYTVFDTTTGPITVAAGVHVQPFTRIEGPSYIGTDTQLFRANIRGGVTIGPNCRIGGEVEESIVHGYSNKYHEGFLGHAYIGEWVNLGAITSNSDLRNDYGEVDVPLAGDPIATGLRKVGCFVGDHSRTGMGSFLNTGTSIGVMCNVLPAGILLPKHVPSFSTVMYGSVAPAWPLEQLFETARIVRERRGRRFGELDEQLFETLFQQTRLERERAFQRGRERSLAPRPPSAMGG